MPGRSPAGQPDPSGDARTFGLATGDGGSARLIVEGPDKEGLTEEQVSAVRQATPLIEFVLFYERELREAEKRLAGELVEAVLARRTLFASGRLTAYGLDPAGEFLGSVILPADPGDLESVRRVLSDRLGGPGTVVAPGKHADVTVFFQPGRGVTEKIERELRGVCAVGDGCFVGTGEVASGVEGLRRSLVQARQAATHAARRDHLKAPGKGGYLAYGKAESHALLLALGDEDILTSFRESLLGPLEEHDRRRGSDLVATLAAFFEYGCRWQETANRLHIHVNTLRHRLARCEQLTGRALDSMDSRVDFYVALRSREPDI